MSKLTLTTEGDRYVLVTRRFAAPPEAVYRAHTDPEIFARARPRDLQTWHCSATRDRVELAKRDYFGRESHAFDRATFLVDGTLPAPAL